MKKISKEEINAALCERFKDDVHVKLSLIPHPKSFKDIQKASERIKLAVERGEKIAIVGDYDVDGVVSTLLLSEFFDHINYPFTAKIPNRFKDGYGINEKLVDELELNDLIITVDNGISAVEAAKKCKEKGIDLIITDHHTPPEVLPEAFAIVNPKQSDCPFTYSEICGAQVAWYLIASLKSVFEIEYDLSEKLDLLAIAIIADMMELKDMNRTMVKNGVGVLNRSNRPAFLAIKQFFKKETIESDDISFLIAPLINSSGRMDDAMLSYRFLRSKSQIEANILLEEIVMHNNLRKEEEQHLFDESLRHVNEDKNIIVVWGEDWHEGVIGIVASRLAKKFHKPSIVFSIDKTKAKGSARSVGSVDILSIISTQEELLLGFGGHKGAAGMSIDPQNLPLFKNALEEFCEDIELNSTQHEDVLGEISPEDIDFELLEILETYEPYGQKNPRPLFILRDLEVKIDRLIGRGENHLKLILQHKNKTIESLFFNFDRSAKRGDNLSIVCTVQKNNFRGLVTPQLLIREILI